MARLLEDGTTANVTQGAVWKENSTATTISSRGVLTTLDVTSDRTVTVTGSYSSGGATLSDTAVVTVRNVDGPLPTKPLNPAPGATLSPGPVLNSAVVALTWGPSSGVVNYDFMVADVTAGTPGVIELQDQAFGTSYVASLTAGKRYRWRVRACNAAGCTSYTSWRYFQTPAGGGGVAEPTVSSISPIAMAADGQPHVLTINGDNFVVGNVVQFKWGVGAGAGVWNTGNAPSISSSSLLTVNMNPGTVNDAIYVRVCRSAAQTTDSDCSSGVQAVTVTAPLANPFIRVSDVVVGEVGGVCGVRGAAECAEQQHGVGGLRHQQRHGDAGSDFEDVSNVALSFAPGETLKTVRIGIVDDTSRRRMTSRSSFRLASATTPRSGRAG